MSKSAEVRATRKAQQAARVEAKADAVSYPSFYAAQPREKAIAEFNGEIAKARQAVRAAATDVEVAKATGVGVAAAHAARAQAGIQLQLAVQTKQEAFGSAATAGISGGDA